MVENCDVTVNYHSDSLGYQAFRYSMFPLLPLSISIGAFLLIKQHKSGMIQTLTAWSSSRQLEAAFDGVLKETGWIISLTDVLEELHIGLSIPSKWVLRVVSIIQVLEWAVEATRLA